MKKIIKIVLVLFVTLTLGACGSSEEKEQITRQKQKKKSMVLEKQQHIKKTVKNVFTSL